MPEPFMDRVDAAWEKIVALVQYAFGKRDELAEMGPSDIVMAKTILDIHRKRTHSDMTMAPLYSLHPIHPLDRDGVIETTNARVDALREHKVEILDAGGMDGDLLQRVLPSVSAIKAVRTPDESFLVYEGNGRLGALKEVFTPEDSIEIEIEEYHFRNPAKIVRRLNRVRRLNGLLDAPG